MRAFIDFEATSLGPCGYPIEVAWVFENGNSESFLISPVSAWVEWDAASEAIHGISREQLSHEGAATDIVAKRLVDALHGHEVFASESSLAHRWLNVLLGATGRQYPSIRLVDTEAGLLELAAALLAPILPSSEIQRAARKIISCAGDRFVGRRHARRALPDAQLERERWLIISKLAHSYRRAVGKPSSLLARDQPRYEPRVGIWSSNASSLPVMARSMASIASGG